MKTKLRQIVGSLLLLLLLTAATAQEGFRLNVLPATATNIQWYVNKTATDTFETIAGANGQSYLVTEEGMYYATFTDGDCANASAYFIFIDENKRDRVYNYPLRLHSFEGADSYQWYNAGTAIGGATTQTLSVTTDGDYYVNAASGYCRMTSAHFITRKVKEYVNHPPNAVNDEVSVKANESVSVFVLDNDSDPDGDALTTTKIITQPQHGTIEENSVGEYTYTPNENFVGTDTITYKVCDIFGACSEAQIIVRVSCLDVNLLEIPQFISPNDDGYNDFLVIKDLLAAAQCGTNPASLKLFNRWGTLVWDISSDDTEDENFGGKVERGSLVFRPSKELPAGVYFYVIAVEGQFEHRTGYIYISSTD